MGSFLQDLRGRGAANNKGDALRCESKPPAPGSGTSWDSITLAVNALAAAERNGIVVYKTQADMMADKHQPAGKVGWVLIDPTSSANTSYLWDGARWQPTFDRLAFALGSASGFQREGGRLRTIGDKEGDLVSILDYLTSSGGRPGEGGDDTAAFVAAANESPHIYVPFGTYLINAAKLPRGTHIFGNSPVSYRSSDVGARAAIIRPFGNASSLFSIEGNITLDGVVAIGNGGGTLFSPSSTARANQVKLIRCSIFKFAAGVSGSAFHGYLGGFTAENCTFAENNVGIVNIADSCIIGGTVNANTGNGIQLGEGANDNTILGVKAEWNGGDNISLYKCRNNVIIGGVIDRAIHSGIRVGAEAQCIINGVMLRRNGRSGLANDAHISVTEGAEATITGIKTRSGADDDGKGVLSPAAAITLVGGRANFLQISNSDLRGRTGNYPIEGPSAPDVYWVTGCPGIPDIKDQQRLPVIETGASVTATISLPAVQPFDAYVVRLRFTARHTKSAEVLFGIIPITICRRDGDASASINSPEYLSSADSFGNSPNSTIQIVRASATVDGSTLTLQLANRSKNSAYEIKLEHA